MSGRTKIILGGLSLFTLSVCILIGLSFSGSPKERNLGLLENRIGVSIPADAHIVEYEVNTYMDFAAWLRFQIPPESASIFTDKICDGNLRQGYNPFTAMSYRIPRENLPDTYVFQNQGNQYYAYPSPSTPETQFGNECYKPDGRAKTFTRIEILVDEANPDLYEISLKVN